MSLNNRIDKVWTTLTIEYFTAIKKKLQMPYAANTMCSKEHILWLHSHEVQAQKDNSVVIGVGKGWAGELAGVLEIFCYLDVNGCYTDLYTCKNSSRHTFKVCAFIVCQLSLNAKVNFKKIKTQNFHHKGGQLWSALMDLYILTHHIMVWESKRALLCKSTSLETTQHTDLQTQLMSGGNTRK